MLERNDIILRFMHIKSRYHLMKSASFSRNSHKKIHDFTYSSYEGIKLPHRIDSCPVNNITSLSIPIPIPPVGGNPYSNAST